MNGPEREHSMAKDIFKSARDRLTEASPLERAMREARRIDDIMTGGFTARKFMEEERRFRALVDGVATASAGAAAMKATRTLGDPTNHVASAARAANAQIDDLIDRALDGASLARAHQKIGTLVGGRDARPGLPAPTVARPAEQPIDTPSALGTRIREARKGMRMSQQRFADLAGVGRRFLSELEAGKPGAEFGKVLACCTAAGIDLLARKR